MPKGTTSPSRTANVLNVCGTTSSPILYLPDITSATKFAFNLLLVISVGIETFPPKILNKIRQLLNIPNAQSIFTVGFLERNLNFLYNDPK